ncbi:odorant receptor [Holotrichia oblita]|uniref:Odorant receptor n=1 Tax=Holotrichia oblita TaxID=644536 RepID=A0ACB9STA5_HOLOL|nr:odorant receptor [Holotrichia oblita]
MYKDDVKRCILPGKILLQGVCCWPDDETLFYKSLGWFLFWNLIIVEIFHAAYVVKNYKDIEDAVTAGATVTTTMEGIVRLHTILTKRNIINSILVKVWKRFWPLDVVDPIKRIQLRKRAQLALVLTSIFLASSIISNSQMVAVPYIKNRTMLLKSTFPFDWDQLYYYEIVYVWHYFSDWFVLFMINSFDFFFVALITICSVQFAIMQEVFKLILSKQSLRHRVVIFGQRGKTMDDKEMLLKCLEQHQLLIGICNDLEKSFNITILIQFFVSTSAICAASLLLSGQLSDAIYECNWHLSYDRDFRKALILIIQRSHRVQWLTAAGMNISEFTRDIYKDSVKRCILPGKILLQSVCSWPDDERLFYKAIGWFFFWSFLVVEIFHVAYIVKHFRDISDAVLTGTTVTALLEKVDSNQFLKMVMYAAAHLAQLFYYCFAGHGLSYEVTQINPSNPKLLLITVSSVADFSRDVSKDGAKRVLLPAKIILQSMACWPDNNKLLIKITNWFCFYNLFLAEIFHTAYVVTHFHDIGDAVGAGATVTTTMEGLIRLYILIVKKYTINSILVKVWKQFWSLDIIEPVKRNKIRRQVLTGALVTWSFLFFSFTSNTQITSAPYIRDHQLILKSVFPFNWNQTYVYEALYIWQYYCDWFVLFIVNAFDFFFIPLVMVCVAQFVIMQEVLRNILTEESKRHRIAIFGKEGATMSDRQMLLMCLEQHKLLIGICNELESSFNLTILGQFFVSTSAICAATLVLVR